MDNTILDLNEAGTQRESLIYIEGRWLDDEIDAWRPWAKCSDVLKTNDLNSCALFGRIIEMMQNDKNNKRKAQYRVVKKIVTTEIYCSDKICWED